MRGGPNGSLSRDYLHSPIARSIWYGVVESEHFLLANLMHGVMISSMYGNPDTSVDSGNENIAKMFRSAMRCVPYVKFSSRKADSDTAAMIEEWKRMNTDATKGGD